MEMNPAYLSDLTTNLRVVSNRSYEERNKGLWWQKVASPKRSESKRQVLAWLLDQFKLNLESTEGQVEFEKAIVRLAEYEHGFETDGLELSESDFEDLDGVGVDFATAFCRKMGAEFAYSPQRQVAAMLNANPTAYDGQAFFSTAHPVSGKAGDLSMGTYSNLYASKPIHDAVTIEVAKANLGSVIAQARAIKSPDGGPRSLKPVGLIVPSEMTTRATDLLGARFIGSAGSQDHQATISAWGLGTPIVGDELGAAFGGSATSYYLVMADTLSDDLGAFVWSVRKDYRIKYPTMQDALYQESGKLRWVAQGRTALAPGHPFLMVKCTG